MKLTEQDIRFFQELSKTETGQYLAGYCARVEDYVHDSRGWTGDEDKKSAELAARTIRQLIIDKIRPSQKNVKGANSYE